MGKGYLKIQLFSADEAYPVGGVNVRVRSDDGEVLYTFVTDENGNTPTIGLDAPDAVNSQYPNGADPKFRRLIVDVDESYGYDAVTIMGVEVFDEQTSILPVKLHPSNDPQRPVVEEIDIPIEHGIDASDHGNDVYPDIWADGSVGDIALGAPIEQMQFPPANEVQIPQFISVHLGRPGTNARIVRVPFIDYIKNVASSEIYPTWHVNALYANIHAQISFALNRIFTNAHRKGNQEKRRKYGVCWRYDFTSA
jgi:hypothetical protein